MTAFKRWDVYVDPCYKLYPDVVKKIKMETVHTEVQKPYFVTFGTHAVTFRFHRSLCRCGTWILLPH
jgi:hypothetical protein